MSLEITIPKLGLTMEAGTLTTWYVAPGERVSRGQALFELETDKISYEVEAEADGYIDPVEEQGRELPVGALVAYIHATPDTPRPAARDAGATQPVTDMPPEPVAEVTPVTAPADAGRNDGVQRLRVSPVAKRIAEAEGIELAGLAGSGPEGAIRKRDIEKILEHRSARRQAPARAAAPVAGVERRPLSPMRRAISQRMMKSLAGTAQMTGFTKVDMTEAIAWREALVAQSAGEGVRVTYTDIVARAAAIALREIPDLNNCIDGDEVVVGRGIHIGIAVALDDGLIVPVIRDVDRLTLKEIAGRRKALVNLARTGRLGPDDMRGGTFTVSNFGSYGGDFETPILNSEQSALLGIGQIAEEPAVRDGQIVIRSMMMMSLTFDHRLIDGAVAGRFRALVRELLERPAVLIARMG